MECRNHPDKEAQVICVDCGKPLCVDCAISIKGKNHCRECVQKSLGEEKPAEPAQKTSKGIPGNYTAARSETTKNTVYSQTPSPRQGSVKSSQKTGKISLSKIVTLIGLILYIVSAIIWILLAPSPIAVGGLAMGVLTFLALSLYAGGILRFTKKENYRKGIV